MNGDDHIVIVRDLGVALLDSTRGFHSRNAVVGGNELLAEKPGVPPPRLPNAGETA